MFKLHITEPIELEVNNKTVLLQPQSYTVDDETFCKQNDFTKCAKCKDYFDVVWSLGQYHPEFKESKQKDYCESCFNQKYK